MTTGRAAGSYDASASRTCSWTDARSASATLKKQKAAVGTVSLQVGGGRQVRGQKQKRQVEGITPERPPSCLGEDEKCPSS